MTIALPMCEVCEALRRQEGPGRQQFWGTWAGGGALLIEGLGRMGPYVKRTGVKTILGERIEIAQLGVAPVT